MNACIVVLGLLQCIASQSPPSTPAEAAAILAPGQFTYVAPARRPTVTIVYSSSTTGPFGEFRPFAPARRLDGTSIRRPPANYGQQRPRYDGWLERGIGYRQGRQ